MSGFYYRVIRGSGSVLCGPFSTFEAAQTDALKAGIDGASILRRSGLSFQTVRPPKAPKENSAPSRE
jgi:hypothetical protein